MRTMRTTRSKTRAKKVRYKIAHIALLAVALVSVLASTWLYMRKNATDSKAAGGSTVISLNPSSVEIEPVGQQMSFSVVLNTNQDTVAAAVVEIYYDATIFEQVTYENGNILPVVLLPQLVTPGVLSISLGAEPTAPFKGTSVIGSVRLRVKQIASTKIGFTDNTVAAAVGKGGNVVVTRNFADISVETTPTPTLTVTGCSPLPTCQPPFGGCYYEVRDCTCVKVCSPTPTITVTNTPTPTLTVTPTPTLTLTPTPSITPPGGYNWAQEAVWNWAMKRWGRIPKQIEWFFK